MILQNAPHWRQNPDRGDETTLLDSGHRFLLPPQPVHCNVFVVDGLYVDDLTLSLEYGKPKDD